MSQKIVKFRAWDILNKKFTYWTMNDLCTWDTKDEKPSALDEWEQFTTLGDSSHVEIYEGDCLGFPRVGLESYYAGIVIFDIDLASFVVNKANGGWEYLAKFLDDYRSTEIIGNVHENPELLTD